MRPQQRIAARSGLPMQAIVGAPTYTSIAAEVNLKTFRLLAGSYGMARRSISRLCHAARMDLANEALADGGPGGAAGPAETAK